jgi:hypothetical protein
MRHYVILLLKLIVCMHWCFIEQVFEDVSGNSFVENPCGSLTF